MSNADLLLFSLNNLNIIFITFILFLIVSLFLKIRYHFNRHSKGEFNLRNCLNQVYLLSFITIIMVKDQGNDSPIMVIKCYFFLLILKKLNSLAGFHVVQD